MSKNWTPFAKMKKAAYNSRRLHLEAIRIGMPIPSPSLSRGTNIVHESQGAVNFAKNTSRGDYSMVSFPS